MSKPASEMHVPVTGIVETLTADPDGLHAVNTKYGIVRTNQWKCMQEPSATKCSYAIPSGR